MRQVVAIDVGGTGLKAGLVDAELCPVSTVRRATLRQNGVVSTQQLVDLVSELAAQASGEVSGVGVVVPGIVDEEHGIARFAANLGWRDVPLRELLSTATTLPVLIGHDVRAGGLAEFRVGAGRDASDAVFAAIGTGIAAALLDGGRPVQGGGYAGELGHLVVRPGGELCPCGQYGCLETVASAAGIARRYTTRTGEHVPGAAEVAELAQRGHPEAAIVWADAVAALADALTMAIALLGPEVVVIGGGLAESGEALLGPLRTAIAERLTFHRMPRLVRAELGDQAGFLGAALLAWQAEAQSRATA